MSVAGSLDWEYVGPHTYLLAPLSWLYAGGWRAYQAIYDLGLKRAKKPHDRILCVGSLLSGGAGKTPITLWLAQQLGPDRVVLSANGYGGQKRLGAQMAPSGPLEASVWGDEPALLRWRLPETPLIVGRDRVAAAEIAAKDHPDRIMLMDDGFQHLPLEKDLSIVIDPEDLPNRFAIPAGGYREPWGPGRKRADIVLPGSGYRLVQEPPRLLAPSGGETAPPSDALLLTAIARPWRVARIIEALGVNLIKGGLFLKDHDRMDQPGLLRGLPGEHPVIVTAKDWVKLREREDADPARFLILDHRVSVEPAEQFLRHVREAIGGV